MRRADGTVPRPRSWQKALELCLKGADFTRTRTVKVYDGNGGIKERLGANPATRSEDFATQEPDLAIESLGTVVRELISEGDEVGATHWQRLLDDLCEWLEADPFTPERDPWYEPADGATEPEMPRRSPDEVTAFFAAMNKRSASGARTVALARLMAFTGLRIGEALALRPQDIDFASGVVNVRRGKTSASRRMAALPADPAKVALLMNDLHRWLTYRNAWNPSAPNLFVSTPTKDGRGGRPLHYQSVIRTFHRVSARAGIRPLNPHQLRHTYASTLLGNGATLQGVSRQLGHANPGVTSRIYSWATTKEQREAVKYL